MQATDQAMLADMARYMHNDYSSLPSGYSAANFPHANMPNLYWWDWNANSGDTGGLVDNDWLTVSWRPQWPCLLCLKRSFACEIKAHSIHSVLFHFMSVCWHWEREYVRSA